MRLKTARPEKWGVDFLLISPIFRPARSRKPAIGFRSAGGSAIDPVCLPMTLRQERVFRLVMEFLGHHGYPPTIAEIQKDCGLCNPGSVSRALAGLIRKEYLRREKGRHRGLRPGPAAGPYFLRRGWMDPKIG